MRNRYICSRASLQLEHVAIVSGQPYVHELCCSWSMLQREEGNTNEVGAVQKEERRGVFVVLMR